MRLIGESGGERDLDDRRIGLDQLPGGEVDSQAAQVLTWKDPEGAAKLSGEMARVYPYRGRDFTQPQWFQRPIVKQIPGLSEPRRAT
jgi:hypothetical protein